MGASGRRLKEFLENNNNESVSFVAGGKSNKVLHVH